MKYYHSAMNLDRRWQLQRKNIRIGTNSNIGTGTDTGIEPKGQREASTMGMHIRTY